MEEIGEEREGYEGYRRDGSDACREEGRREKGGGRREKGEGRRKEGEGKRETKGGKREVRGGRERRER